MRVFLAQPFSINPAEIAGRSRTFVWPDESGLLKEDVRSVKVTPDRADACFVQRVAGRNLHSSSGKDGRRYYRRRYLP